jgi:hypothetical protein
VNLTAKASALSRFSALARRFEDMTVSAGPPVEVDPVRHGHPGQPGRPRHQVNALHNEKGICTTDGMMPADGPQTVLKVLSAFDINVTGHKIDLSRTYTNDFVTRANPEQ